VTLLNLLEKTVIRACFFRDNKDRMSKMLLQTASQISITLHMQDTYRNTLTIKKL